MADRMRDLLVCAIFIASSGVATSPACIDGDRFLAEGSCKSYRECSFGTMLEKTCPNGYTFDRFTLECALKGTCEAKECEDSKVYRSSTTCKQYYQCVAGRLIIQTCPPTQVFLSSENKCGYGPCCNITRCWRYFHPMAGSCSGYVEWKDGAWEKHACDTGLNFNPVSQKCEKGNCTQCTQGEVSPGTACDTFQYCDQGFWHDDHCGLFRRFDPSKKKCVWLYQYTCPAATTLLLASSCEDGTSKAEEDYCSKYSICNDGVWTARTCPEGYLYDDDSHQCMPEDKAHCNY